MNLNPLSWFRSGRAEVSAPVTRADGGGYTAAGSGRRSAGWNTTVQGVNSILFADGFKLLQRSRQQVRQNPWAANAIETFVSNAIGNGVRAHSQHPDPKVRKLITEAWKRSNDELDADELLPFDGLQSLILRSAIEGGECFVRKLVVDDPEISVPLQLRVMESEQLPTYYSGFADVSQQNILRMGIEMNADTKKRVAYHFYSEHPFETVMFPYPQQKFIRIPARDIIHHFRPLRPGQIRGIPWLAPVLTQLFELDQIQDAELARQKTQALFAGFIKVGSAQTDIFDETLKITSSPSGQSALDAATPSLEPGLMTKLLPNEEVTFSDPKGHPGFGDFFRVVLHSVAAGMNITYEQLTGDLKEVNYSSIRAGLIEFRRRIEQFVYTQFCFQVLRPVWKRWMSTAVLAGVLPFRDFLEKRFEYEAVMWQPPGWDWVDPMKDVQATLMAIRGGLDSRDRVIHERGLDPEAVDRDNQIAHDRAVAAKLVYDSDASQVLQRGQVLDTSDKADAQTDEEEKPGEGKKPTGGIRTTDKATAAMGGLRGIQ
jgi:lambda family phage portal protein